MGLKQKMGYIIAYFQLNNAELLLRTIAMLDDTYIDVRNKKY